MAELNQFGSTLNICSGNYYGVRPLGWMGSVDRFCVNSHSLSRLISSLFYVVDLLSRSTFVQSVDYFSDSSGISDVCSGETHSFMIARRNPRRSAYLPPTHFTIFSSTLCYNRELHRVPLLFLSLIYLYFPCTT